MSEHVIPHVVFAVDVIERDQDFFHIAGEKYIYAIAKASKCLPLLLPTLIVAQKSDDYDEVISEKHLESLLDEFDGLVLSGSDSNVHPSLYGAAEKKQPQSFDPQRDSTVMKLINMAIRKGVPTLGICRGLQEINVALGGTLHQAVQEVPGHIDHRYSKDEPEDVQYAPRHGVNLVPGGMLSGLSDTDDIRVSSLHTQGIDRLGEGLTVEAVAEDGLIEAFRLEGHPFLLATQWHPEWRFWENPFSEAILKSFGEACMERRKQRKFVQIHPGD